MFWPCMSSFCIGLGLTLSHSLNSFKSASNISTDLLNTRLFQKACWLRYAQPVCRPSEFFAESYSGSWNIVQIEIYKHLHLIICKISCLPLSAGKSLSCSEEEEGKLRPAERVCRIKIKKIGWKKKLTSSAISLELVWPLEPVLLLFRRISSSLF